MAKGLGSSVSNSKVRGSIPTVDLATEIALRSWHSKPSDTQNWLASHALMSLTHYEIKNKEKSFTNHYHYHCTIDCILYQKYNYIYSFFPAPHIVVIQCPLAETRIPF